MYKKTNEELVKELESDLEKGLNKEEVDKRREKYGFNELQGKKKQSIFVKFLL